MLLAGTGHLQSERNRSRSHLHHRVRIGRERGAAAMEHATAPAAAAAAAALLPMLLLLLLQLLLLLLQLLLLLLLLLDMGRHDTTRAKVRPSSGWGGQEARGKALQMSRHICRRAKYSSAALAHAYPHTSGQSA